MSQEFNMQDFEINRSTYDEFNPENLKYKAPVGITEELVRQISKHKQEPEWMLNIRLKGFKLYQTLPMPTWGPSLDNLNLDDIHYFMRPDAKNNATKWDDVPQDIKNTFVKLGIPQAEHKALAGVGAQYESEVVYHKLRKDLEEKGVVFLDCDEAVKQYPELVKKYFMTSCVPINLHKFTALHAACWSGGTFIYVPKNVHVDLPLQAYFRMNAQKGGQFEHTLIIVDEGSNLHYIEGCFTKGNLVATRDGEKPIESVTTDDQVLTSEGEYKSVKDLQKLPYTGKIAKIQLWGDTTNILEVTQEHPILYVDRQRANERNVEFKPRWNMPMYFEKGDYLCIPINKKIIPVQEHVFDYVRRIDNKMQQVNWPIRITPAFCRLVGYYLAEGSISSNSYLNFSFNSNEKEYMDDVKYCLKEAFGTEKVLEMHHKQNHGTSLVVCSVDLARIFHNFGTSAKTKQLPQWMMFIEPALQKEIIKGWFNGDGNYYAQKCATGFKEVCRINTTSQTLVRQGRELLLRNKIVASINKQVRDTTRVPMFTLGITGGFMEAFGNIVDIKIPPTMSGKKRASMFGIDDKFAYLPIKSIDFEEVKNLPVYNFGVEGHETYTANAVAVHNCSAPQYTKSSLHAGCVEIHVLKGARARYSSIENWSRNTYNLNTKRAVVAEDGIIEWVNGNLGSGVTMLYPASLLIGNNSKSNFIGIAFANKGQNQDTGCKVIHVGKNTSSTIVSKSIAKNGGITSYRGLVSIRKGATGSKSSVECDALMIDNISQSNTYPYIDSKEQEVDVAHEATVGKISEEQIFYLMSRGLSEEQAVGMIVSGFIEPIVKELPLEYAVELNRLIELEMEGTLG